VIQNEKGCRISTIKSDHGGEFRNERFDKFCEKQGIKHNFSAPRTPQQNGVVERKNRSLEELGRMLLNATGLPKYLWADAVSTACYVLKWIGEMGKKDVKNVKRINKNKIAYDRIYKNFGFQMSIFFFLRKMFQDFLKFFDKISNP